MNTVHHFDGTEIAIIGMAGRFPGANNLEAFWQNLCDGTESITFLSDQELDALGVDPKLRQRADYVKAASLLEGVDQFDASFFGYTSREAETMDPQHRIFLECAWEALEHAGYDTSRYPGLIGVYAGATLNSYLLLHLASHYNGKNRNPLEDVQLGVGNAADFLTTRVSYKLNLTGPSHTVQSACSTSLVAVHTACQSLLNGECDMALAGGVSINLAHRKGYIYLREGVVSPDGHCRAFDAGAQGTIFGSGVGVVVLKRLEEALRDGDFIHALIRGSAINNDGALKAGYTAPSVEGQARVIAEALANAEVNAETVSYIEAHGTGTSLGDPIEIQALTKAFREYTDHKNFCAIGTVKTNIGHLDVAAGVTGLIKSVLMLEHQQIPPSLHFQQPNPEIDFASSPFYVNTTLQAWPIGASPRRSGVSSFGIGGTNAHIILEESPPIEKVTSSRPWQLLLLSAKTLSALDTITDRLVEYLKDHPHFDLADVAYTYQVGRKEFAHRRMFACQDRAEAIRLLERQEPEQPLTTVQEASQSSVVFMFPGLGSQYVDMGRQLYACEPTFSQAVDQVAELFLPHLGFNPLSILYPCADQASEASQKLKEAKFALPTLFVIEYALAQLWQSWGVYPQAMIGHSTGEYLAACLSGVFSLEEAVGLVALRCQLMQEMLPGAMLAVELSEKDLLPHLGQLSLATVNRPTNCAVAGPEAEVQALCQRLEEKQIPCKMLPASHAFHSTMMEPLLERFVAAVRQVRLKPPRLPYISNVTGDWIREEEATDPNYWGKHLRLTVRFSEGIRVLQQLPDRIFLEVGPSNVLTRFARAHFSSNASLKVIPSLQHPYDSREDENCLLEALGKLWLNGAKIDWEGFYANEQRQRLPLPTYPFERQSYWVETSWEMGEDKTQPVSLNGKRDVMTTMRKNAYEHAATSATIPYPSRQVDILRQLKAIIGNLLGENVETLNSDTNFFRLGLDSLILIQANHTIKDTFGVEISIRQLFEDLSTLRTLATYIDQQLPPAETVSTSMPIHSFPAPNTVPMASDVLPLHPATTLPSTPMEELFVRQMQLLSQQMEMQHAIFSQQLELLRSGRLSEEKSVNGAAFSSLPQLEKEQPEEICPRQSNRAESSANGIHPPMFVAFQPLRTQVEQITPRQRLALETLIARYTARTQKSKQHVQQSRFVRTNHRNSMAFRLLWKEMIYPTIASHSQGAHIYDIDGNKYIDLTMGFGVALFGHAVPFVQKALSKASKQGWLIGPYSEKAEQVARLIAELTGVERVAFYNSGTEAVMVALRLARAATGRTKIAIFSGAFHGTFDGLQAHMDFTGGEGHSVPLAPGISPNMVKDVLVLNYGTPQALETIRAHAHELAAVIVEPVQSRRPDLQPREFLKQLRQLTTEIGTVLVFDEIITGFRIHPGGAQTYFDIQADLVTYGKVLGGGMPIGVVAGKTAIMDSIDGGVWNYGDASYPPRDTRRTIVGGTFCEHPLAMAAAEAVLEHLKKQGPALQQRLNERTASFAERLNSFFQHEQVPIRIAQFGSLFRFLFQGDFDLLYYYLLDKGVYTWEGRTCFLSTAHTDQDLEYIIQAVKDSIREMREGGFLPDPTPPSGPEGGRLSSMAEPSQTRPNETLHTAFSVSVQGESVFPLSPDQRQLWFLTQMSNEASCAYSESAVIHMQGDCNLTALRDALQKLVDRHEALRTTIGPEGETQCIKASLPIHIPLFDWSPSTIHEQKMEHWLLDEIRNPFQLDQAPLLRSFIIKQSEQVHDLIVIVHHMAADGWSWFLLLQELAALYSAECQGATPQLAQVTQFREYCQWQSSQLASRGYAATKEYWTRLLSPPPPPLLLPESYPRPLHKTYQGMRLQRFLPPDMYYSLQQFSRQQKSSLFITALSAFQVFLYRLTNQRDFVVGVPVAGQPLMKANALIGHCTNMLPVRCQIVGDPPFASHLQATRSTMLDMYQHQHFSFASLAENELTQLPPITIMFNMDRAVAPPAFSDLQIEVNPGPVQFVKFDLSLNTIEVDGTLRLDFDVNTDLFDPTICQRWFRYFEELLSHIINNPSMVLSSFPLPAMPTMQVVQNPVPSPQKGSSGQHFAPRDEVEEQIAQVWKQLFHVDEVSIYDNFFEIGGQSLLAMQFLSRLRQLFAVNLPLKTLFDASTIADMSAAIRHLTALASDRTPLIFPQTNAAERLLLSFAQQRLWYVDQLGSDATYNIFCAIRITGTLDIRALQHSLNEIVRRHETLRSRFIEVNGQPFQIIEEPELLPLQFFDFQQGTEHDQENQVQELLRAEVQQPFDLSQDLLLRATLLQLGPTQHVMVLVTHHIIFDGWSLSIFLREMTSFYQAFLTEETSPLPELSMQYRDFAQWQHQWLQGEHYEQQLSYWKQRLGRNLPLLELPLDRPRPALQTYRGATYRFKLPCDMTRSLRQLSQAENVTLFMLLLAAFQALLHLYSNQSEIVVGTPSANRQHIELEDLIGLFVNMLVIRTDISGHPSFRELLGRVREAVLGAHAHQDIPFEKLVEELKMERDPSYSPLFQVMFLLDTLPERLEIAGLHLNLLQLDNATAKFDLSLTMYDVGEDLLGDFEYNTDLFDADTIMRMAEHFTTFLRSVIDQPEAKI